MGVLTHPHYPPGSTGRPQDALSCTESVYCLSVKHVDIILWCIRHLVSSIGWLPDCRAGGRRFEPWPDQHSGSESACFDMTSAIGYGRIRMSRPFSVMV